MLTNAKCVENLPVFGAIVFALYGSGPGGPLLDWLSVIILSERILQRSFSPRFSAS